MFDPSQHIGSRWHALCVSLVAFCFFPTHLFPLILWFSLYSEWPMNSNAHQAVQTKSNLLSVHFLTNGYGFAFVDRNSTKRIIQIIHQDPSHVYQMFKICLFARCGPKPNGRDFVLLIHLHQLRLIQLSSQTSPHGADPAAQARQLSRAHGCTHMASLLKALPAGRMLSSQGHLLPT